MVRKYAELYFETKKKLKTVDEPDPAFAARMLLAKASGKTVEYILSHLDQYASEETEKQLLADVDRMLQYEPLAYVLGKWSFYGLELTVTPDVLIPRDDTEAVTELAIEAAKTKMNPRVLDLCTGSGCIGLAIASQIADAKVVLGDISRQAIHVARQNCKALQLQNRVTVLPLDVMTPCASFLGTFDVIVSNPPYITSADMEVLQPSVKDYEPSIALHGGVDGLDFYRAILQNFASCLASDGCICLEFGIRQEGAVCQLLYEAGFSQTELRQDAGGIVRAVRAKK